LSEGRGTEEGAEGLREGGSDGEEEKEERKENRREKIEGGRHGKDSLDLRASLCARNRTRQFLCANSEAALRREEREKDEQQATRGLQRRSLLRSSTPNATPRSRYARL
jgi:hypothetical protein